MIYTVNRFYLDGETPVRTAKVVLNLSNRGSDAKEARKYGKLIEKKGVPDGVWRFVGILYSDVAGADRVTQIGGADDVVVLRRTGIDVRSMN
jgi:hypothetical protein